MARAAVVQLHGFAVGDRRGLEGHVRSKTTVDWPAARTENKMLSFFARVLRTIYDMV